MRQAETVQMVIEVAGEVGMTLGMSKCVVAHMRWGKRQRGGGT